MPASNFSGIKKVTWKLIFRLGKKVGTKACGMEGGWAGERWVQWYEKGKLHKSSKIVGWWLPFLFRWMSDDVRVVGMYHATHVVLCLVC